MKFFTNFFYHIGQGVKGIFRNPVMSTASLLVLICCMVVTGTFALIIDNINFNFKQLDNLNRIIVWMDEVPESDASEDTEGEESEVPAPKYNIYEKDQEVMDAITAMDHVSGVIFFSKSDAFEEFKESEGENLDFLEYFDPVNNNPLRASYRVTFEAGTDTDNVRYIIKEIAAMGFGEANIYSELEVYDTLLNLKSALTTVSVWLLAILLVISLFITINSTRLGLHSRREEIQIMRYVGATNSFVRAPFIIESVIIGLTAAIVSFAMQYYLYAEVIAGLIRQYPVIQLKPFGDYVLYVAAAFAAIGVFAGLFGSVISIRKYMKV